MGETALKMTPPWSTSFIPGTHSQSNANRKLDAYEQGSVLFMQLSPGLQGVPYTLSSSTRASGPGTDGSGLCLCDRELAPHVRCPIHQSHFFT